MKTFILLISIFTNTILFSQNSEKYVGIINVGLKESYSYQITYKIDDKNNLTGYSITDDNKPNETKCMISGKLDPKNKTISFVEYKILETKSKTPQNEMCFLHVTAKFKTMMGANLISGKFIGKYSTGVKCSEGKVNLVSQASVMKVVDTLYKMKLDTSKKEVVQLQKEMPQIFQKKDNDKTTLKLNSDTIILKIWDEDKIDNDKIKILINNKPVKESLTLSKEEYVVKIKNSENITSIEIIALNEGYLPPNTSRLLLIDGQKKHLFVNTLTKYQSLFYNFSK
jgi:hypothetical protein